MTSVKRSICFNLSEAVTDRDILEHAGNFFSLFRWYILYLFNVFIGQLLFKAFCLELQEYLCYDEQN